MLAFPITAPKEINTAAAQKSATSKLLNNCQVYLSIIIRKKIFFFKYLSTFIRNFPFVVS